VNGTDRTNKTNSGTKKEDGMASYEVKTGAIKVRFITASGKSCNIARSLKEFIAAAMETDEEFTLMPLSDFEDKCVTRRMFLTRKKGSKDITVTWSSSTT
jgi:hypothetical protein